MKHEHRPSQYRKLTHSGMKYECVVCWRYIVWVAETPTRKGHWRVG